MAFADQLQKAVVRGIQRTGDLMYVKAQTDCPVRTGELRRSGWRQDLTTGYAFGFTARHAAAVEYGTQGGVQGVRATHRRSHLRRVAGRTRRIRVREHDVRGFTRIMPPTPPRHFVRNAVQSYFPQLLQDIAQSIKRLVSMIAAAPYRPRYVVEYKLRAWNNYCVIRLLEARDVEIGGLLIPHANGKAVVHGVIESIGPDSTQGFCLGDLALVPPYGIGHRLEFQRVSYLVILDYDILGTWPQEALRGNSPS